MSPSLCQSVPRFRAWIVGCFAALLLLGAAAGGAAAEPSELEPSELEPSDLWRRENLVAWCIVPFDALRRGPEERAEMLDKMGIHRLAYDYRAEHIPTFDAEVEALKRHGIELTAWWFPTDMNDEARLILDVLRRHKIRTQLWVTGGGEPTHSPEEQSQRVAAEADRIGRIAKAAAEIGCTVGLYNHGGWFGEPENQIEIIQRLGMPNVGIVYNLHHGHEHVGRFAELLTKMKPYLMALNLNGMTAHGDQSDKKILPIGVGELDLELLKAIEASGYDGPIGILNHTDLDAEARLLDNIEGLEWLVKRMHGHPDAPRPDYRTWSILAPLPASDTARVQQLVDGAAAEGDAIAGISVFASQKFACLSCHKVGRYGGTVGPPLDQVARQRTPAQLVESLLWPQRVIEPAYRTVKVLTADGSVLSGYVEAASDAQLVLRDPSSGLSNHIDLEDIEDQQQAGSLMPDGLADAMRRRQQQDLVAFLMDLGKGEAVSPEMLDVVLAHWSVSEPASFDFERGPLHPEQWTQLHQPVNQDRLFDFYAKQAAHFGSQRVPPPLLEEFPGLDGPNHGHWGNQNEAGWADARWNATDLGPVQCGVFRVDTKTVARGVCVQLGEQGEMSACFNPQTLSYEAVWKGGFVKFSSVRHGFMDGLLMDGELIRGAETPPVTEPFQYRGFYRYGKRIVFAYRIGDTEYLDAPWVEQGKFVRMVAPVDEHPLLACRQGGPALWPQAVETEIQFGTQKPYAIDTIAIPTQNPWNALVFCGGHDFLPNGDALVCTMQGDVWQVSGLDARPEDSGAAQPTAKPTARWRRIAGGLQQALGLKVSGDEIYVLGRDRITRLHDTNGDGEIDYYENFCNGYETSPSGHDFICGLERDADGNFYTASGNQGLLKISPDGQQVEIIATGFRNPDGLGIMPDGTITVPCSEGEWTPASMVCAIRPGRDKPFFGYRGPRDGQPPEVPMSYLPRGLDNSSGGQVLIDSDRWGPFQGQMVHTSFGAGTAMLLLCDEVQGQLQGGIVPLPGDYSSGVHRGRFRPQDGQLYLSGMAGWGTYTTEDGCFQRLRYTGDRVQQPTDFHVHSNGIRITFSADIDRAVAEEAASHFAQTWNYRYSSTYGSPEYSTLHAGVRGHDTLRIASAHVLPDNRTLFLEMPDLQPVNQLHVHAAVGAGEERDLFITVHRLDEPFEDFPGYEYEDKQILPHPILADLRIATESLPNPWRQPIEGARSVRIQTAGNLSFETREFRARPGEAIQLTLVNPDVVPHNWALLRPGTERAVGELANRLVGDPDGAARQYVPETEDVLAYTDVVDPKQEFTIHFRAPDKPGYYPYICTFPGHWMVMRGGLIVE